MLEKENHYKEDSASNRLSSILDRDRIVPSEYLRLIHNQGRRDSDVQFKQTPYADGWLELFRNKAKAKDAINFLKQKITGYPVIDLGSGEGIMKDLAPAFGPTEFISVDIQHHTGSTPNPLEIRHSRPLDGHIDALAIDIQADMLDFVFRLKDGVANFTINGIDYYIVDDPKYHEALAKEIIRATRKNGLIFGIQSEVLVQIAKHIEKNSSLPVRQVDLEKETGYELEIMLESYVFEKME